MMPQVTIYATHTCPYCHAAFSLLAEKGFNNLNTIWVDEQPQLREKMREVSGRHTVPQIFIDKCHIGGYDDLAALNNRGELEKYTHKQSQ